MSIEFPTNLIELLDPSKRVVVLTGAGVSAESGVPTFREAQQGLWSKYRAEELATPQAFESNPQKIWEWYTWRRSKIKMVSPNPGHYALAKMEKFFDRFTLLTQNVDGLHALAGSRNIIEVHGNITKSKCSVEGTIIDTWDESSGIPPKCPDCGAYLRPAVVWFGESLPQKALDQSFLASSTCDVFFSIGTSSMVQPAASFPLTALQVGAALVEININETPLTRRSDFFLKGASGEILPLLVEAIEPNS